LQILLIGGCFINTIDFNFDKKIEEYSYKNLRGQIFSIIKDAIISGFYKPEQIITEGQISDIFKCSRTPVREALRYLEETGLIKTTPGVGLKVSSIDSSVIQQEFEIRKILEVYAIKKACDKITQEQLESLKFINNSIEDNLKNEDYFKATKDNEKFHSLIFHFTDNDLLIKIEDLLWASLRLSFLASNSNKLIAKKWDIQRFKEHQKIVEALENRDKKKCEEFIIKHVEFSYEYCLEYLNSNWYKQHDLI